MLNADPGGEIYADPKHCCIQRDKKRYRTPYCHGTI